MKTSRLSIAIRALEDIIDPIERIKRDMPRGYILNGPGAVHLSNDPGYLKEIARVALADIKGARP